MVTLLPSVTLLYVPMHDGLSVRSDHCHLCLYLRTVSWVPGQLAEPSAHLKTKPLGTPFVTGAAEFIPERRQGVSS